MEHPGQAGIFLETAHPVKFPETVEGILGHSLPIPDSVQPLFLREKKSVRIPADFSALKTYLLDTVS
ncbi:MAG TPA: hypothetical protein VG842_01215 [Sediminibacterium sp.]|nr:hypothetical protein [Sediminibacterium sp.]